MRWKLSGSDNPGRTRARLLPETGAVSLQTFTLEVSARKGIHQPAERHAGQQEENKGPEEVLGAVAPAALAQEGKDERSEKGEERHRLNVAQHQRDRKSTRLNSSH